MRDLAIDKWDKLFYDFVCMYVLAFNNFKTGFLKLPQGVSGDTDLKNYLNGKNEFELRLIKLASGDANTERIIDAVLNLLKRTLRKLDLFPDIKSAIPIWNWFMTP
jgi:hypothetical protein